MSKAKPETDKIDFDPSDTMDKPKDLSGIFTGLWPGNPSQRTGNFFINLAMLDLKEGQTGVIGYFPPNFVFERVDVHLIASNDDKHLKFSVYVGRNFPACELGTFEIAADLSDVIRKKSNTLEPGICVGNKNIYLYADSPIPDEGRILITFVGYQIEPWR